MYVEEIIKLLIIFFSEFKQSVTSFYKVKYFSNMILHVKHIIILIIITFEK